jgi:hypothetical protein
MNDDLISSGVAQIPRCPESVQYVASVPDEDREDA